MLCGNEVKGDLKSGKEAETDDQTEDREEQDRVGGGRGCGASKSKVAVEPRQCPYLAGNACCTLLFHASKRRKRFENRGRVSFHHLTLAYHLVGAELFPLEERSNTQSSRDSEIVQAGEGGGVFGGGSVESRERYSYCGPQPRRALLTILPKIVAGELYSTHAHASLPINAPHGC